VIDTALGQAASDVRYAHPTPSLCLASFARLASAPSQPDPSWFHRMPSSVAGRLLYVIKSGLLQPTSWMGCYASHVDDYSLLASLFDDVLGSMNTGSPVVTKPSMSSNSYDLRSQGLTKSVSIRARVSRNFEGWPLPSRMSETERLLLEQRLIRLLCNASATRPCPVFSLTPHDRWAKASTQVASKNPWHVGGDALRQLRESHVMFQDTSNDVYLTSAGVSSNWPSGRGCIVLSTGIIAWYGEEDHLRLIVVDDKGHQLGETYNKLIRSLEAVAAVLSSDGMHFARHPRYGFVSSCPSNLGLGLRISVLLPLHSCRGVSQSAQLQDWQQKAAAQGLSLRGFAGEGSEIRTDDPVEVTNSKSNRPFQTAEQMLSGLLSGASTLFRDQCEA